MLTGFKSSDCQLKPRFHTDKGQVAKYKAAKGTMQLLKVELWIDLITSCKLIFTFKNSSVYFLFIQLFNN